MTFLWIPIAFYLAVCAYVYFAQARLVWFPDPTLGPGPESLGMEHEELELAASDGVKLHGWFLPAERARGAVVFCHGNAGNVSQRLLAARVFVELGLSVVLFDYRGYGRSEGRPSEEDRKAHV